MGEGSLCWCVTRIRASWLSANRLQDRINGYFEQRAKPVLRALGLPQSLEAFYRAYSLVSSRAFLVDAYHGLALVPVADA